MSRWIIRGERDPICVGPTVPEGSIEVMPVSEHEQSVGALGERWGRAEQEINFQKSETLKWNKYAVEERERLQALRVAVHGHVQVIRGMCTDELDHREIDRALVRLDSAVQEVA